MPHCWRAIAGITICSVVISDATEPRKSPKRDGSSFERAIIIRAAQDKEADLELQWIARHHPHAPMFPLEHGLVCHDGILFDIWVLATPGHKTDVFFDVGANKEICGKKADGKATK